MPRNRDYDDFDDDDDEADERKLEGDDLVKHLRRQVKARDKRLADVEKELGTYRVERQTRTVASVLEGRGVNPKYARFITREVEDPTEEAVNKWLDENAELVGVQAPDTTVSEENQQKLQRMQSADRGSKGPDADPVAAQLSDPNLTPEALELLIGKPLAG